MSYEFQCPEPITVDIRIAAGVLDVRATERTTATVTVTPLDSSEASQQAAQETRVDFKAGKHLVISAPEHGWRLFRRGKLRVDVAIPLDCTLTLKVASADVTCSGRYRDAVINTASGDVTVDQIVGDTSINTASGDLRIGHVGGDLRVNAASGDVRAQHIGGSLSSTSASGDLEAGEVGGSAKANSASGDIAIGLLRRGETRVNSASGDVSLGVAAGTGVWLDVQTMSGKTISDLAVGGDAPAAGGATLNLKVRTASGDVTVRRVVTAAA